MSDSSVRQHHDELGVPPASAGVTWPSGRGRATSNPAVLGGKPLVRGRRLAVEHVLMMLAAGDTIDDLLQAYDWLSREDVLACLAYASHVISNERVELPRGA